MRRSRGLAASAVVIVALLYVAAVPLDGIGRIHDRFLCLGDPPSRIGAYDRTGNEVSSAAELSKGSGAPVVIEMPAFTCPTYQPPGGQPLGIWLKVSDSRYIGYGRGGGP